MSPVWPGGVRSRRQVLPACGISLYGEPARIRLRRRLTGLFVVLTVLALVAVGGIVLLAVNLGWASFLIVLVLLAAGWLVLTYLRDRVAGDADAAAS